MNHPEGIIYHITARSAWDAAEQEGSYQGDTLASEGFIHASTRQQVIQTANRFYHGQHGLVVLEIDCKKVQSEIRYEPAPSGELFPHIYGALETQAVVRMFPIEPGQDGNFLPPEGFE